MDELDLDIPKDEIALLRRAAAWPGFESICDLSEMALRQLSREQGVDFATALFFARVVRSSQHSGLIRRISCRQSSRTAKSFDGMVAVVPGAFYREYPHTGAGGEAIMEEATRCGCRTKVIPVASVASPAHNGHSICQWLANCSDERIVLVSLSKGGTDVKLALSQPNAAHAFRNVVAWLNVGGILNGSPMVRWILSRRLPTLTYRLLFWWLGHDFSFATELDRQPGSQLDTELLLPPHIQALHVVGVPLRKHMSSQRARRWHRRLSSFGPNDSVTLLTDALGWPGHVLPVWGTDHYLQKGWDAGRLVATMLNSLAEDLNLHETVVLERAKKAPSEA